MLIISIRILKFKMYDSKVDLWSVGVILYGTQKSMNLKRFFKSYFSSQIEVIFGYAPFISNSFEELERKILDDKPIQVC
jgi:serine/threonine protein kinase